MVKAYAYDRESSEFTVFHFKQIIRLLADTPEVEKVHIVAHSRGTDVAVTALRELMIEGFAAGEDVRERFRIANLILASPDLDFEVVLQRVVAEHQLHAGLGALTVYVSQADRAIRAAEILFGSKVRVGRVQADDLIPAELSKSDQIKNVAIINVKKPEGGKFGHFFYLQSPAASSDLCLVIREGAPPGEGSRAALIPLAGHMWRLDKDYPKKSELK
jgi:esterase/lipase superfamily enzyme